MRRAVILVALGWLTYAAAAAILTPRRVRVLLVIAAVLCAAGVAVLVMAGLDIAAYNTAGHRAPPVPVVPTP